MGTHGLFIHCQDGDTPRLQNIMEEMENLLKEGKLKILQYGYFMKSNRTLANYCSWRTVTEKEIGDYLKRSFQKTHTGR